ncbi:MAG: NUDIX domain-containing protein [Alphaproteobacteria bacterium]|nr:NUDIX domain-containing protein [Alphaproteobacteria bacterium]
MTDAIIGQKRAAVACILRHGDRFLLLKRAKDPWSGKYIPIGGKVEPFEDPTTAALREVFEETGIKLDAARVQTLGILTETSPIKFNWINFIYTAEIDNVSPPECIEGEFVWIDRADIESIPMPATDKFFFKYLDAGAPFILNAIYDSDLNLTSLTEEIKKEKLV